MGSVGARSGARASRGVQRPATGARNWPSQRLGSAGGAVAPEGGSGRMIKKRSDGKYDVVSEDGSKRLGKDLSKKGAVKRLRQVEYFKRRGK